MKRKNRMFSADKEVLRTLFIANLDERVTEEVLYEVFLQAGPIESVRIPKDKNGKQRTFGFVTYVHDSAPPYAMQLYQGLTLYGKDNVIKLQNNVQPPKNRCRQPDELEAQCGNSVFIDKSSSNRFPMDLRNKLQRVNPQQPFHRAHPYDRTPMHFRRNDSMEGRNSGNRMASHHNGSNYRSDQRYGYGVHRR